ncbi:MAG TPA: AAA family ATPase [Planctomycetota bacterium]|nr:AAA family ATPase [Planctomycetota bacterium]
MTPEFPRRQYASTNSFTRLKIEVITRFFRPPRGSFFLFGPRGTGKSSWTRTAFPEALRVDLLDPETFRSLGARPERLAELVEGNPGRRVVVVDEVQKVPELLPVVHGLIEAKRGLQFVLTGSSARKLKRTGADLLAGRSVLRTLHPFLAAELGERFRLADALLRGLLPLVVAADEPGEVLRTYAALYLREEIQLEGFVRNVGQFSRFLEAISFSHASVLNVANVARECGVERNTVEGYLSILEDLLLAYRLPVFTRRAKRATAAHPKFFLFDAGVFRSLRPRGPLDRPEEIEGAALEGLVVQHLLAWNAYRGERNRLSYWRTRSGVEVDVVLYGEDGLLAVEVKNARRVRPEDLRSLRAIRDDYPEVRPLLVYRGAHRLKVEGIPCVPCEEFLRNLRPDRGRLDPLA